MENQKLIITLIVVTLSASLLLAVFLITHPSPGSGDPRQRADILEKFDGQDTESLSAGPERTSSLLELSANRAVSPARGIRNNSVIYYEKGSGRVFDASVETGKNTPVSERELPGFISSVWAPRRNEVIGAFTAKEGAEYRYYSLDTGRSAYLGTAIRSLVFSPSGSQIAFFEPNEQGGSVSVAQPDGTVAKKILETRLPGGEIFWPAEELLAFIAQDSDAQYQHLYTLTPEGALEKILDFKRGLSVKFSPGGDKVLFSSIDGNGTLILTVMDLAKKEQKVLPAETFASKCAWSLDSKSVICGVPTSNLAADPTIGGSVSDEIYEISLQDGTQKVLWSKAGGRININVREIFLSSLEDYVVFVNAFDEKLYSLPR